jgi:hypothetical protein
MTKRTKCILLVSAMAREGARPSFPTHVPRFKQDTTFVQHPSRRQARRQRQEGPVEEPCGFGIEMARQTDLPLRAPGRTACSGAPICGRQLPLFCRSILQVQRLADAIGKGLVLSQQERPFLHIATLQQATSNTGDKSERQPGTGPGGTPAPPVDRLRRANIIHMVKTVHHCHKQQTAGPTWLAE